MSKRERLTRNGPRTIDRVHFKALAEPDRRGLRDSSGCDSLAVANTQESRLPSHAMAWTEITRLKYQRDGLRYASDTTDEEWAVIEPHMPPPARCGRTRKTSGLRIVRMWRDPVCAGDG